MHTCTSTCMHAHLVRPAHTRCTCMHSASLPCDCGQHLQQQQAFVNAMIHLRYSKRTGRKEKTTMPSKVTSCHGPHKLSASTPERQTQSEWDGYSINVFPNTLLLNYRSILGDSGNFTNTIVDVRPVLTHLTRTIVLVKIKTCERHSNHHIAHASL